jgi:hypothetical protein
LLIFALLLQGALACARHGPHDETLRTVPQALAPASSASVAQTPAQPAPVTDVSPPAPLDLEGWLRARLPVGGRVDRGANGAVRVVHVARAGDTLMSIAPAYIDLTTAYTDQELTSALAAANQMPATVPIHPGYEVVIPHVVAAIPPPPAESRLGWPEDHALSGIYAHIGMIGAAALPRVLDSLAASGMNAIVVDGKDYGGWLTYRSAIPLAVDTKASSHAVLPSVGRLVRVAHARGIRVILRVACFHDAWTPPLRPDLAIRGMHNWLNPNEPKAQDYILAIIDELLPTGVDEIQLDYVRYPTEGISHADFELGGKKTTDVIAGFVERVHARTQAAGVPLSLDIFGVVAWQYPPDVKGTGQDLRKLGPLVEAISPMVYPSHFADGAMGFSLPGEHPEVVGYGTKQAAEVLKKAGATAIVRPWIQAFPWHAHGYDVGYVSREIGASRASEGVGWLAWNAGGYYREVFAAAPPPHRAAGRVAQK